MDIKKIRSELGLSAREFATLIGYQDDRTIRRIESGEQNLSGSAEKLLTYILQGLLDDTMKSLVPEHIIGTDARGELQHEYILRMHRPRFLAVVSDHFIDNTQSYPVAGGIEYINIAMWIDDPNGHDQNELLQRAAADFEIYTQDSFDQDD